MRLRSLVLPCLDRLEDQIRCKRGNEEEKRKEENEIERGKGKEKKRFKIQGKIKR
jgi:hypothetical protein